MTRITAEDSAPLDNFHVLEEMAFEDDRAALQGLTHDEVVLIDFAQREIADDPDSEMPLRRNLE